MDTVVVNRKYDLYDIYIGRVRGSEQHFGNPFSTGLRSLASVRVPTRADAINAFRRWLNGDDYEDIEPRRREWILENMIHLRGKRLGCFCKPLPCHGDVYVQMLGKEMKNA